MCFQTEKTFRRRSSPPDRRYQSIDRYHRLIDSASRLWSTRLRCLLHFDEAGACGGQLLMKEKETMQHEEAQHTAKSRIPRVIGRDPRFLFALLATAISFTPLATVLAQQPARSGGHGDHRRGFRQGPQAQPR